MTLAQGDAFVVGDIFSFQQAERIRSNWRAAAAVSNPQHGSLWSQTSTERLFHRQAAAYKELVQEGTVLGDNFEILYGAGGVLTIPGSPLHENLLSNSGVGVWSNSDENEGLGSLAYDNLTGNFEVGEAVNHVAYISANLSFHELNPDEIRDAGNGFLECQFMAGDSITVAGTVNNDGTYTIASVVAGTIELDGGDDLADEGAVACTITSNTVIATGKVQTDSGTVLVLGACAGRFRDDDGTYAGWIVGASSGATATVNMPDSAAGVDLVRNGEFSDLADDPPPGWTAFASALLTTEAGGQVGNCLMITENGAANPYTYQLISLVKGKIYKFSHYVKQGTESTWIGAVREQTGNIYHFTGDQEEATGSWVKHTITFEAVDTGNAEVRFQSLAANGSGLTLYFDEISIYKITPCCTGSNILCCDCWSKNNEIHAYREHNGSNTKIGSFYSIRLINTHASGERGIVFPVNAIFGIEEWYQQFAGQTVTIGCWVKAKAASEIRLRIYDGSEHYSSRNAGTSFEWLELTTIVDDSITDFLAGVSIVAGGDVYVSQLMFAFASSLGEGNYQPIQQEIIWLEKYIPSNKLETYVSQSTQGPTTINLEADSDSKLPKGAKSLIVVTKCNDSGSVGANCRFYCRAGATEGAGFYVALWGLENDTVSYFAGPEKLDTNGDFQFGILATGGSTFDVTLFHYMAVQVN